MEAFWKAIALLLITAVLTIAVGRKEKEIGLVLTVCACCCGALAAGSYFRPILELAWELAETAKLEEGCIDILLKVLGISLVTEITQMLCTDSGSASLGKMAQLLGNCAMLTATLPLIQTLLTLIREILGGL